MELTPSLLALSFLIPENHILELSSGDTMHLEQQPSGEKEHVSFTSQFIDISTVKFKKTNLS